MVYNGLNSTIGYYRGKHDTSNSIVAGAMSGAIFKSTRGTRQMAISSGICAGVAGSWAVSIAPSQTTTTSYSRYFQITRQIFFGPGSDGPHL